MTMVLVYLLDEERHGRDRMVVRITNAIDVVSSNLDQVEVYNSMS